MATNSNRNRVTLKESYSLLKQNNEILKQNNLLLMEGISVLKSVDERLRKIGINTS